MKNAWENNAVLKLYTQASRQQQEVFVSRLSQVLVIGAVISVLSFFFEMLNSFVGVIVLPVALIAAWFVATKVVAPRMVLTFDKFLDSREQ
ncbi:MAG: hypothetical protein JST89_12045 [Cyanobacteria bacterium SZAS-4]|nr:hypothetical protein [Cyanobacteria bacterium SZAS-4]